MIFNSIIFLWCFLPLLFLGSYFLKTKYQNSFLIIISLFFYAWGQPEALLIMLISVIINFYAVRVMDRVSKYRKLIFIVLLGINIFMLFYFKYAHFIFNTILHMDIKLKSSILPLGISFYTFSALSYVIDVYKKEAKAASNFSDLCLYMTFFPKVTQGPIALYNEFAPQIQDRRITTENIYAGIQRFIVGLGKKTLIANVLAEMSDAAFGLQNHQLGTKVAWLGAICYTLQIYYDFSGYSDMAIGISSILGFHIKENFNYPYISTSVKEFWRRWHISLSSWFRNYIYIPLGGNRKGTLRTYLNTLIVFVVTGVWHGANFTFWLWGAYYGILQVGEGIWGKIISKSKILGVVYTNLIVIFGWVLFRADNLSHAGMYIKNMLVYTPEIANYTLANFVDKKKLFTIIAAVFLSGILVPAVNYFNKRISRKFLEPLKNLFLIAILLLSIMSIAIGAYNPFIYFQF